MAMKRNDTDEPEARLRKMIEEFRVGKQRQLVRRGMTLWNPAEAQYALSLVRQSWPDDSHRASGWSKLAADVSAIAQTERGLAEQPVVPCAECGTRSQHPVTVALQHGVHARPHSGRTLRDRTEMFGTAFRSELGAPAPAAAAGPDRRPPARGIERPRSKVSAGRAQWRRG
jgi:hypothetical protein